MKKIITLLILISFPVLIYAQNGIIGDGFGTADWATTDDFSGSAGDSRIGTFNANATGDQYFRTVINWSGNNDQYTINTDSDVFVEIETEYKANQGPTTSTAMYLNVSSTSYNYVFKTSDGGTSPSHNLIIFEVQGTIRTVSSVSHDLSTVYPGQEVTVTATLDGSFSSGQGAYLRYSNDGFSTSTTTEMTGSATTYTATIPSETNTASSTVSYYIFTSGDGLTIDAANSDWYTINLNNNSGSNYSYTVEDGWTTSADGNWSAAATWTASTAPSTTVNLGTVTVDHNVTGDQNADVSSLSISSGKTLTVNNGNTLQVSGGVTGDGSFDVNGTFQINAGGYTDIAPNYGSNSTLKYNTASTYGRSTEWSTTTGAGYPHNVTLSNNTSLNLGANGGTGTARQCEGDLTINSGSELSMNEDVMTASLTVIGDIANSGTLTLGGAGGDLYVEGTSFTNDGTFNPNGSIFQMSTAGATLTNNSSSFSTSGELVFSGNGTIDGTEAITLDNITINGTTTLTTVPTINGTLQINTGGSLSASPTYGSSSTLRYNTGAAIDQGNEWLSSNQPSNVTIVNSDLTLQYNSTLGDVLDIQPGGTLNTQGYSLTISDADGDGFQFNQNGAFNHNGGKVVFAGTGSDSESTISGTITFNDIDIYGKVDFGGTNSTVEGTLAVKGQYGRAINNAFTYGDNSTLVFDYGGLYTVPWSSHHLWNLGSTVGAGVPKDVIIISTELQIYWAREVPGDLTINSGGTVRQGNNSFIVHGNLDNSGSFEFAGDGAEPLEVKGNLINQASGDITLSNVVGGDLYVEGTSFTNDGAFDPNGRIFQMSTAGATLTNNSSNFSTSGELIFSENGTIDGTEAITLDNITINGTTTLSTVPTINGILQINTGGSLSASPTYGSSSTLRYNTGATSNRGNEWNSNSGAGYPNDVEIANNTTLDLGANGGTATARECAGNLTVNGGSELSMNIDVMTAALTVKGNVLNNGTITLSSLAGGDLKLEGNWESSGTFNPNSRAVFFEGSNAQTINHTSAANFDYVIADKLGGSLDYHSSQNSLTFDNNLTIENGTFNIGEGKNLTISGDYTNNGGSLTIQSGSSGTGSLITNGTVSGDITVQRYLANEQHWHYISSPINLSGTNFDAAFGDNDPTEFFRWDEDFADQGTTGWWIDIRNDNAKWTGNTFGAGEGYALSYYTASKSNTYSLSGTPYNSNQSVTMTETAGSTGEGSNLVGNPFCSTIAINSNADADNNFLNQNADALDDSYEAIYIWDESEEWSGTSDADYDVYSNSSSAFYASPGQAFMVVAASNGATLNFNTSIRKHGSSTFYKSVENADEGFLTLYVTNPENQSNKTRFYFKEGMTKGLDPSYDVGKMKGNPDLVLYTKLIEDNGVDFAIQALPYFEEDYSVPVGIDIAQTGEYTFEVAQMEQIPEDVHVYLQDLKTGTLSDLKKTSTYTCVLDATGSITDRFVLHFTLTPFGEEELQANESPIQIWTNNKTIKLYNPEQQQGTIRIFNLYGQQIMQTRLNGNQQQQIAIEVPAAYYLVNVISEKSVFSKKVFVH